MVESRTRNRQGQQRQKSRLTFAAILNRIGKSLAGSSSVLLLLSIGCDKTTRVKPEEKQPEEQQTLLTKKNFVDELDKAIIDHNIKCCQEFHETQIDREKIKNWETKFGLIGELERILPHRDKPYVEFNPEAAQQCRDKLKDLPCSIPSDVFKQTVQTCLGTLKGTGRPGREKCTDSAQCAKGTYCHQERKVCERLQKIGEECTHDEECSYLGIGSSTFCNIKGNETKGTCTQALNKGEACGDNYNGGRYKGSEPFGANAQCETLICEIGEEDNQYACRDKIVLPTSDMCNDYDSDQTSKE